jgi:hypothetical protein
MNEPEHILLTLSLSTLKPNSLKNNLRKPNKAFLLTTSFCCNIIVVVQRITTTHFFVTNQANIIVTHERSIAC